MSSTDEPEKPAPDKKLPRYAEPPSPPLIDPLKDDARSADSTDSTRAADSGSDVEPASEVTSKPARAGRMRSQEAGVTKPRQMTVAEARAKERALAEQREREYAAHQDDLAQQRKRKVRKQLMGGAAVVGVVALVAVAISAMSSDDTVNASCVDKDGVVVSDNHCSSGSPGMGGIFIFAGSQYRYNYGGTGSVGQHVTGGSTVKPKNATIKTSSGTTIQRGGLGSKMFGSGS